MRKILLIWDVKTRGSPATLFYRALCGYDYRTKSGKIHSAGILDELPEGVWQFVSRSALIIDAKHAVKVERIFKEFSEHILWRKFEVEI
ncbi:MAG: hypothetical protein APU95_00240 [Hadesarchaea archaeon YNP_N21]|nr:MAG: hypothetical protein APU95_00240 [Hadesarchaea archaeon YNP_N21]